jgi:hypothetical protein
MQPTNEVRFRFQGCEKIAGKNTLIAKSNVLNLRAPGAGKTRPTTGRPKSNYRV